MAARGCPFLPASVRGCLLSILFLADAAPAQPQPLPEITGKALAEKIVAARASYATGLLDVEYEEEQDTNGGGDPIIVKLPGKFRYVGDGLRWRVDVDSMIAAAHSRSLAPHRWSSGFDGSQRFTWMKDRSEVTLGETAHLAQDYAPQEVFWHGSDGLLLALAQPTTTIGERSVDGVPCYLVTADHGHRFTSETLISPRQGYLPVRQAGFHGGRMHSTYNLRDLREVSPGIWVPGQIFSVKRSADLPGDTEQQLHSRRLSRVLRFEPGPPSKPEEYRFDDPLNVDVTDIRLGYTYHNDPWWPEVGRFLRDRFDWPQPDSTQLASLGTSSSLKLEGKPAPPIRAAAWLNGQTLDWERLRGKVTLLLFWTASSPPCGREMAPLAGLYRTYHHLGLEIVAVHAPSESHDKVREFARKFPMPFPIAVDQNDGDAGATARAYGVRAFPCVFLVDHTGLVRAVDASDNGEKFVDTVVVFLKQVAGRAVPQAEMGNAITAEVLHAASDEFRRRSFAAPDGGRITGTLKDEQGQVIPGAKVVARLHLVLGFGAGPGGHITIDGRRSATTTGPDGRFELAGLCKGNYTLVYSAEGRATLETTTTMTADLRPVAADAVLDQGDAIEGTVRDESGKPLAGVEVLCKERLFRRNGKLVTNGVHQFTGAVSDAEGQFRFDKLLSGSYSLVLVARGFEEQTLEWIPAGSSGVTATLKRALK